MCHKVVVRFFVLLLLLLPQPLLVGAKYTTGTPEARKAIVEHFEKHQTSPAKKQDSNDWNALTTAITNGDADTAINIFNNKFGNSLLKTKGKYPHTLLNAAEFNYNQSLKSSPQDHPSSKTSKKSKTSSSSKSDSGNLFEDEYNQYKKQGGADNSYAQKNLYLEDIIKNYEKNNNLSIRKRIYFYDKTNGFYQFTNFFWGKINTCGQIWKTSEHFFQANKFETINPVYQKILNENETKKVFDLGKSEGLRDDWDAVYNSKPTPPNKNLFYPNPPPPLSLDQSYINFLNAIVNANISCKTKAWNDIQKTIQDEWKTTKIAIMYYIVKEKFTLDPDLKQLLLDTENKILIEDSFRDAYWGIYSESYFDKKANMQVAAKLGLNMLGIILMQVRKELQNESKKEKKPKTGEFEVEEAKPLHAPKTEIISEEEKKEIEKNRISRFEEELKTSVRDDLKVNALEDMLFLLQTKDLSNSNPQERTAQIETLMYKALAGGYYAIVEKLFWGYFSSPLNTILNPETNKKESLLDIAQRVKKTLEMEIVEKIGEEIVETKPKPVIKKPPQDPLAKTLALLKAKLLSLAKSLSPKEEKKPIIIGKKFDLPKNTLYITLVEGDITKQQFVNNNEAAIVNAANSGQIGSEGVAKYMQQASGKDSFTNYINNNFFGCPTGEARLMPSLGIAKNKGPAFIINTVGPKLANAGNPNAQEENNLKSAIEQSLTLADKGQNTSSWLQEKADQFHKQKQMITAIAFPAISAGIFGYYSKLSAPVVIKAMITYLETHKNTNLREIRFVTLGGAKKPDDYTNYLNAIKKIEGSRLEEVKNPENSLKTALKKSNVDTDNKAIKGKPPVIYKVKQQ